MGISQESHAIEVVDVTHHYGARSVLQNVSLTVEQGELLALMGPNGMGKSTLVGLMGGVLWPISGEIRINGKRRRIDEETELSIRQQIAYLPADLYLNPTLSGRGWVLSVGRIYGVQHERLISHVDLLLKLFQLSEQADWAMKSYSTGQRKKIALCAALVTDAPILLLDEPFAGGLDPSGILALKGVLQHHKTQRDRTIVMATPVPEQVEELAHRVALIDSGQIKSIGSPEELKTRSGTSTLAEAYEKLVGPGTFQTLERYVAEGASR